MKNNCTAPDIVSYRTELMGLAALWIYIFHEWVPLAPNVPVLGFIEGFIKQIGFFGVDIFFLLSGMGLIFAIEKTFACDLLQAKISPRIAAVSHHGGRFDVRAKLDVSAIFEKSTRHYVFHGKYVCASVVRSRHHDIISPFSAL